MVELHPGSGVTIPQEYLSQALTGAMDPETGTAFGLRQLCYSCMAAMGLPDVLSN